MYCDSRQPRNITQCLAAEPSLSLIQLINTDKYTATSCQFLHHEGKGLVSATEGHERTDLTLS